MKRARQSMWAAAVAGATALLVAACGGGSTTPSPSTGGGGGGGGTTGSLTVTITSAGVDPKNITVARGSQVTFVNNDTSFPNHDVASNPHPEHTDCPEINLVGFLTPGQSRQTGNLNTVRTCGYHDHNQPSNAKFQGTITIQ